MIDQVEVSVLMEISPDEEISDAWKSIEEISDRKVSDEEMYSHDSGQDADLSYSKEKRPKRFRISRNVASFDSDRKNERKNRKEALSDESHEENKFVYFVNVDAVSSSDESDEDDFD